MHLLAVCNYFMHDKHWGVANDEALCIKDEGIWTKENTIIHADGNYIWRFIKQNIITENTDGVESKDEALLFSKVKYE